MINKRLWIVLAVLVMAALACSFGNTATKDATATPEESVEMATEAPADEETPSAEATAESTSGGSSANKTEFPLPENVSNFIDMGDSAINFQTNLSIKDVLAFYQDALSKEGYTERKILTSTTDTTLNLVFDGHKSGKAIVVQAVDLGNGSTNINIRLEAINN